MAGDRFNVNESLESVGRFGKWRFVELGFINLIKYISSCIVCPSLAIVFIGAQPRHHCWIPEGNKPNESIPMVTKDGVTDLDKCNVYKNFSSVSNETEPCPLGWYYDTEVPGNTIVSEWGLVCERSVLTETSQMVLVAGVMVGSVFGSLLADAFGRKVTFLASVVLISIITFITAWVDNYYLFVVLRFFTGVLQQAIVLPGFVLSCELFPASDRTVAGLMIQNFWAVGMWILALFAYLLKDWRHLLIFCSFPGVIAVPAFWLISESIPWLVAKGRIRDAKKILEKAARWNNVELPEKYRLTEEEEQLLKIIDDSKEEGRGRKKTLNVIFKGFKNPKADKTQDSNVATYTVLDIFKSCRLTTFALMMCFVWCTSALVYYGLSLNTGSLAGDPYMNFFYSGLVEIPAYTISAIVLQLIGRRWPIFVFHIIAGVALFITIFIKNETALVTLAMIGKFGISGCFGSVFLWAPELFPTTLRNVGIGIASLGGRVGNIVAPYTPFISRVIPWLPNVVFGVMCLIAAVFTLLLPETLGRPLPQTIEEVEKWTRTLSPEEKRRYEEAKKLAKQRRQQEKLARQNGPSSKPLTENGEAN